MNSSRRADRSKQSRIIQIDDKFLEATLADFVENVVSGDRHLLDIDFVLGIEIVNPRRFFEVLEE